MMTKIIPSTGKSFHNPLHDGDNCSIVSGLKNKVYRQKIMAVNLHHAHDCLDLHGVFHMGTSHFDRCRTVWSIDHGLNIRCILICPRIRGWTAHSLAHL